MSEDQLTRFEFFVRSHLPRNKIKDIIIAKLGSKSGKEVTDEMAIVVGSLAKLFCGELIEQATAVLRDHGSGKDGVEAKHVTEAIRRMQRDGRIGDLSDSAYCFGRSDIFRESDMDNLAEIDLSVVTGIEEYEQSSAENS